MFVDLLNTLYMKNKESSTKHSNTMTDEDHLIDMQFTESSKGISLVNCVGACTCKTRVNVI